MNPIILASASPRRQDFFRLMGIPFTCIPAMIDETPPPGLSPQQVAETLAQRKALAVAKSGDRGSGIGEQGILVSRHSELPTRIACEQQPRSPIPDPPSPQWIFAADTIVVLDGAIFGKPADRNDARRMLERLAGRRHEVITAMALCNIHRNTQRNTINSRSKTSEVAFAPLTGAEIEWYLNTGEWEGAAGAYRLQGLGACLIETVNGSPSGVAGLPLYDFYAMLRDNGYPFGA